MSDPFAKIGAVLESAKELTLEAAVSASSRLLVDDAPLSAEEIKKLLNARSDRDRLAGMRQVIGFMSKGRGEEAQQFFPDVMRNTASQSLDMRKLVFVYLIRYAPMEHDLALMSVNTIQKSLSDSSPTVRSLGVRVLSSLRVPAISGIVLFAIKKGVTDVSPLVRRAVAGAIAKCYDVDPSTFPQLVEFLQQLLTDKNVHVVGSAIMSMLLICPDRLDLIHPIYRRLCRIIPQLDTFAAASVIDLLVRYNRTNIAPPKSNNAVDADTALLLSALYPAIENSLSPVLIMSAVSAVYALCPGQVQPVYQETIEVGLVRLLKNETLEVALTMIKQIILQRDQPNAFSTHINRFVVFPDDTTSVALLKIAIMSSIKGSRKFVLSELKHYATSISYKREVQAAAVSAIGSCAAGGTSKEADSLVTWLLRQIRSEAPTLSECLTCVRLLIQQQPDKHVVTVTKLAKIYTTLDTSTETSPAKASVVWLVSEFVSVAPEVGEALLYSALKNVAYEDAPVRAQIMDLASKVYLFRVNEVAKATDGELTEEKQVEFSKSFVGQLYSHALYCGRFDPSYEIRDKVRRLGALLSNPASTELATLMLQAPKQAPKVDNANTEGGLELNTSSAVLGTPLSGYVSLPPWEKDISVLPDARLRDEPEDVIHMDTEKVVTGISHKELPSMGSNGTNGMTAAQPKLQKQTLDEFFADTVESEDSSEEEEESESDDAEGEGEYKDEEEGEDEDEDEDDEEEDEDDEEEEEEEESSEEDSSDDDQPAIVSPAPASQSLLHEENPFANS